RGGAATRLDRRGTVAGDRDGGNDGQGRDHDHQLDEGEPRLPGLGTRLDGPCHGQSSTISRQDTRRAPTPCGLMVTEAIWPVEPPTTSSLSMIVGRVGMPTPGS